MSPEISFDELKDKKDLEAWNKNLHADVEKYGEEAIFGKGQGASEPKECIISAKKGLIETIHVFEGEEINVQYGSDGKKINIMNPCMECGKERLCSGSTANCPVCDGLMTESEYNNSQKQGEQPHIDSFFAAPQTDLETKIKDRVIEVAEELKIPVEEVVEGLADHIENLPPKIEDPAISTREIIIELPAVPTKQQIKEKQFDLQFKQFIPSFVILFNGAAGSGKSTASQLFPTPFIADNEHGKNCEAVPYSDYEQIQNLRIGTMEDIKNRKTDIDIVDVQGKDLPGTWENIKEIIKWYIEVGYQNHQTLVIDTAYWLRKSRTAVEERTKGRQITQYEYRPVTNDNQELIYDLIRECRKKERNLIFITHWEPKYETRTNDKGYDNSVVVGRQVDVKEWILDAVTWRIDFLKPEESGMDGQYIVYLDKSPKYQYSRLNITGKSLFNIINSLETFKEEIEAFNTKKAKADDSLSYLD